MRKGRKNAFTFQMGMQAGITNIAGMVKKVQVERGSPAAPVALGQEKGGESWGQRQQPIPHEHLTVNTQNKHSF